MDTITELWDKKLPNFGYVIDLDDGGQCAVVLGGQTVPKAKDCLFRDAICRRNQQMRSIYQQALLSEDDKIELAKLMKKMISICESRIEGIYTRDEQEKFVEGLSESEKSQLDMQIQMLKQCRSYYHDYIFRR